MFAATGPIDMKIVGDVPALYELSRSMTNIHNTLAVIASRLDVLPSNLGFFWHGQASDSFGHATKQHSETIDYLANFTAKASSVTDAYGGLIERGRGYFADYADAARKDKLTVEDDRYILPPTAPDLDCMVDGSDREAKTAYRNQVKLFQEIRDLVSTWRTDAEAWITTNFGPLLKGIADLDAVDDLIKSLRDAGLATFDALMEEADKKISNDMSHFLDKQQEYEDKWQEHKKDGRSGDPAREARGEKYDEDAHRKARDGIDAKIKQLGVDDFLSKGGKAAGALGGVAAAAYDVLYDGKSPSTAAAGMAGGAAGAAAGAWAGGTGGAALGSVVPGVGTIAGGILGAIGGAAGGYFGGKGGEFAWENWVSLRTRQAIDEGLKGTYQISPTIDPRRRNQLETYGAYR